MPHLPDVGKMLYRCYSHNTKTIPNCLGFMSKRIPLCKESPALITVNTTVSRWRRMVVLTEITLSPTRSVLSLCAAPPSAIREM